jgi:FKBP-type peptidyl-prolyl cis-trans isomerase
LIIGLGAGLLHTAGAADTNPAVPPRPSVRLTNAPPRAPRAPELPPGFKDQKEQISYSIGMNIGSGLKQGEIDLDVDVVVNAMKDVLAGRTLRMTDEQMRQGIQAYRTAFAAKRQEIQARMAATNHMLGEAFLAENKKKPGVEVMTVTLPGGAKAEMQYKVITEGTGAIPKSNDVVEVIYHGRTIRGVEFEPPPGRKMPPGPMAMTVGRASVKGLNAALEHMKVGSKWEIYLPSTLAHGDGMMRGNPLEPGSTVIYEIELTGIKPPGAPRGASAGAPLTSDIIRVPSADQIKKGEQPKIMSKEEVEKEMQKEKKAQ